MEPLIRKYRPADLAAVYDICVRTGHHGGDARGRYSDDRLLGDLYAAPYVTLYPDHAYVLDDGGGRAAGYVIGTPDTERFVRRFRSEWMPRTPRREPADPPRSHEDELLAQFHRPENLIRPELAGHPAHLHIDLLPEWQGRGYGRSLMAAFLAGLAQAGVPRVHLAMSRTNTGARAFYDRLGFTELPVDARHTVWLGRDTHSPLR